MNRNSDILILLLLLALLFASLIFGSYGTGYDAQSFIYGQF